MKISVDSDQSVLSRSLALRNTVTEEVYEGRSRLSKWDGKLIMDLIWFKVKKQLKRERVGGCQNLVKQFRPDLDRNKPGINPV